MIFKIHGHAHALVFECRLQVDPKWRKKHMRITHLKGGEK
jgi:hypothetical protein